MRFARWAVITAIIVATAGPALAQTLLAPGEVGLFRDSDGRQSNRVLDFPEIAYVLARLDPLGLSRVQFSLGVGSEVGLPAAFYIHSDGIVDADPDPDRFDLRLEQPEVREEGVVVLLAVFFPDGSPGPLRMLPRQDEHRLPLTTSSAPGAVPRPMNWRVPPWRPVHDYFAESNILINSSGSAVVSIDTDGDRGGFVTVHLDFPYYSYWVGNPEPFEMAYGPDWTREDRSGYCPSCTQCPRCQSVDWIETRIEWDPRHARFVSLQKGVDAARATLVVQDSGPGFVQARLEDPGSIRYYDRVLALDLEYEKQALPGPLVTRTVSSYTDPHPTGGFGLSHGGRLLPGCEFFDVVDDDAVDGDDVAATLEMVTGALGVDDDRVCRADVNRDGHLNAADAVLIARRAAGLGDAPTGSGSANYGLDRSQPDQLAMQFEGIAGADLELGTNLAEGATLFVSAGQLTASASVGEGGVLRVSVAQPVAQSCQLSLSAHGLDPAEVQVLSKRGFGASGAEVEFGSVVSSPATSSRVLRVDSVSPNPFNSTVTLSFTATRTLAIRAEVFDVRGRRVRKLGSRTVPQGPGELSWDGLDEAGLAVASGVYSVVIRTEGMREERRVTLVK